MYLKIESIQKNERIFSYIEIVGMLQYEYLHQPLHISLKEVLIHYSEPSKNQEALAYPKDDEIPAGYKIVKTKEDIIAFNGNAYLLGKDGQTIERL